jgi:C4-dicarboxylate-specific signal transduction histidine kinase
MKIVTRIHPDASTPSYKSTREEAEAALRTIRWTGDDPDRGGPAKTPARLARAFKEYFSARAVDPARMPSTTTFETTDGYDEMIVLHISDLTVMNRRAIAGQLSATIAHEINQPLAAIASSGSAALRWLSLETPDLDEVRSSLQRMVADSHRAAKVIDAVRAMYKRDARSKSMVDLNELVAEVLDLLRTEVVNHDVTVRTVETGILPRVYVDRVQLQQVVINLIKNATDAMSTVTDRPRTLRIRTGRNDREVIISVEDSGVGLNPDDMDKLFAPFFTTKPQGMGIGLSICRSIIETHGGRLQAAPGTPHGTVFEFTVPMTRLALE